MYKMKYKHLNEGYFKPITSTVTGNQSTDDTQVSANKSDIIRKIQRDSIANHINTIENMLSVPSISDNDAPDDAYFLDMTVYSPSGKIMWDFCTEYGESDPKARFANFVGAVLKTNNGMYVYPFTGESVKKNHKMYSPEDPKYIFPILQVDIHSMKSDAVRYLIDTSIYKDVTSGMKKDIISMLDLCYPRFEIAPCDIDDMIESVTFGKSEIRIRFDFVLYNTLVRYFWPAGVEKSKVGFEASDIISEFKDFAGKKNYKSLRDLLLDYCEAIISGDDSAIPTEVRVAKFFHASDSLNYLDATAKLPGMDQVNPADFIKDLDGNPNILIWDNNTKSFYPDRAAQSDTLFPVAKIIMGNVVTDPNSRFVQTKKLLEEQLGVPVYLDINLCNGKEIITV